MVETLPQEVLVGEVSPFDQRRHVLSNRPRTFPRDAKSFAEEIERFSHDVGEIRLFFLPVTVLLAVYSAHQLLSLACSECLMLCGCDPLEDTEDKLS